LRNTSTGTKHIDLNQSMTHSSHQTILDGTINEHDGELK